jgi:hypothetical protein
MPKVYLKSRLTKHFRYVKYNVMTASLTYEDRRSIEKNESRASKLLAELRQMTRASIEHEGLLNHAQAAVVLDVSPRRIGELVELGKLTRLDFLGRTYVSVKEIVQRRKADVKAGRPRRSVAQNLGKVAKIMSHYDVVNVAVGALTPEPEKKRRKK